MSVFNSPVPSDEIVAADVSQIIDALNATLGIIDTAQDALGRLVLPSGVSHPGTPSNFQEWVRSNEGVGGRRYMRHSNNGGQNVPYLPLRQYRESSQLGAEISTTSTSFGDAVGLSIASVVTTGGRLRVRLEPGALASYPANYISLYSTAAVTNDSAEFALNINGSDVAQMSIAVNGASANPLGVGFPGSLVFNYLPASPLAGVTVKLRYRVAGANITLALGPGLKLTLEEFGDN